MPQMTDPELHISAYTYFLPRDLIAQRPAERRDASRMLVYHRPDGPIEHRQFSHIAEYLRSGDLLVLNNTRVFRNRLHGVREGTGGKVEIFLLQPPLNGTARALTRSGGKLGVGDRILFPSHNAVAAISGLLEGGERLITFSITGEPLRAFLDSCGEVPLPPYIQREQGPQAFDHDRYQTVYAEREGAVAAPTAGFHFTQELMSQLQARGVRIAYVTLHVGRGTFEPVKVTDISQHQMHSEWFEMTPETAELVNQTRANGGRVIPVGTTSVRVLESSTGDDRVTRSGSGETAIYIRPPYEFRCCDALITNFHLPCSSLLMLVSALAGRLNILRIYEEAVSLRYRFFSYGDAMLIL